MISVLILTLNEEENIANCINSLKWSDDIVVLDSYSSDKTCEIAESLGARVIKRKFDNWSSHQNWALQNIDFIHEWIYYSDADEIVPKDLRDELIETSEKNDDVVAYYLRYKNFFMGKWIKHCGIYPVWVLRFYKKDFVKYERVVNPIPIINGNTGYLKQHFNHYSFNKGIRSWLNKHVDYARGEALQTDIEKCSIFSIIKNFLSSDSIGKRRSLKLLSYKLPFRFLFRFVYMYFIKLGFMDGKAGFHYCMLLSFYEYMIEINIIDLKDNV